MMLPAKGYPVSEQSLTEWFRQTHAREPTALEIGALMAAIAQRDATPPHEGPEVDLQGWSTTPFAPPATGR
jgi:hypothetical protein